MKKYPFTILISLIVILLYFFKDRLIPIASLDSIDFNPYQILTYPLLHGNILHLSINVLMFYTFGKIIEIEIGTLKFFILYFILTLFVGIYFIFSNISGNNLIGISGVCYGLMCYFMILFPKSKLTILFLFNIRTEIVVIFLILLECVLLYIDSHIAHDVHLFGCVIGLIASIFIVKNRYINL